MLPCPMVSREGADQLHLHRGLPMACRRIAEGHRRRPGHGGPRRQPPFPRVFNLRHRLEPRPRLQGARPLILPHAPVMGGLVNLRGGDLQAAKGAGLDAAHSFSVQGSRDVDDRCGMVTIHEHRRSTTPGDTHEDVMDVVCHDDRIITVDTVDKVAGKDCLIIALVLVALCVIHLQAVPGEGEEKDVTGPCAPDEVLQALQDIDPGGHFAGLDL
mmetsp:Transcript_20502/g.43590  ORF Transcript_20502/g.43590 Transcript_20502/m.43590 type:complete len:214 (+) Transcript_20502:433-1074(+)